jgi:3-hydroxyacyl-CoA dehydrogenase
MCRAAAITCCALQEVIPQNSSAIWQDVPIATRLLDIIVDISDTGTCCLALIGNRMLAVRRLEAEGMIAGGASPYAVDRVAEAFGLPMGPFRMGDLTGLDLGWSAETSTGSTVRERLCEAGRRGQKTGKGFYHYDETGRAVPSPEAQAIIAGFVRAGGGASRVYTDQEILGRLLWPMIDEGARLLGEGIARSADDIDVVWLNGYGWPAFAGGPMFHAAQTGWHKVAAALRELGCEPSEKLLELAAEQA